MGVKIAVVGGGSTYTPELIDGLATREARLPVDELALLDIEPERLGIVGGLRPTDARSIVAGAAGSSPTTDRDSALDGADFVVIQLRVGGQAARLRDETIPPRFGCVGQETTGPGGFTKALRTVPVVLELAEAAARRAAKDAWLVDFTNPVGIVTQALLDEGHRAIGLCNVAIGFQRRFAERFGVDACADRARARRPQPPDVVAGDPRGRSRPPAGPVRLGGGAIWPRRSGSPSSSSGPSARSRPTTSATTTSPRRSSPSSAAATPGRRR